MAECIKRLKDTKDAPLVECLTPDFAGNLDHVEIVAKSGLDVFAHNMETVEELTVHHNIEYTNTINK